MHTYQTTFTVPRLWVILITSSIAMFGALLYLGGDIYQEAPPTPTAVVMTSGEVLFDDSNIRRGQNIWQSTGGMQQGSIWGHGGYVAPDWSADWLQREALVLLDLIAADTPLPEFSPDIARQTHLASLRKEMRENTYNEASGVITVSPNRAKAIEQVTEHFSKLFMGADEDSLNLRRDYAMPAHAFLSEDETKDLSAFFFWTSWAASTNRPDDDITYTSNWPHEPLVGNRPTPANLMWSLVSIVLLLAGIGAIVSYYSRQYDLWRDNIQPETGVAKKDFLDAAIVTPSMRATAKYFWLVTAMFIGQVLLGMLTAHYAVEGQGFYGLPLVEYLPYAVTRTWHTQLAVYWIATGWRPASMSVRSLHVATHRFKSPGSTFFSGACC